MKYTKWVDEEIKRLEVFEKTCGLNEFGMDNLNELRECRDSFNKLNIPIVTQQSEPLINSGFLKYIASNRPLLLFELTNEMETYQELINGG